VVFASDASNLVSRDRNGATDIFVRDLARNRLRRVNVNSSGVPANGRSTEPSISFDGTFVAFRSGASNLVPPSRRETLTVPASAYLRGPLH
jgi:Tol biopolymer transport system component